MIKRTIARQQKTAAPIFTPVRDGVSQRKCACGQHTIAGGECAECRKKRLQRKAATHSELETVPPIVHEVLRSPGQPLDGGTRTFMEPRFSHDFSQVRVHTDAKAIESAQAVNALAYTVGHNVVFNSGQYRPGTNSGRRLLAHELAHTLQQPDASLARRALEVAPTGDAYEQEAERVAEQVVNSHAAIDGDVTPAQPRLQRLGDLSKRPSTLRCPLPPGSPSPVVENILFATGISTLTAAQKATIEAFVVSWRALGASADVRVDGFASKPGNDESNWRLSCKRTEAVVAELRSPSSGAVPGIPSSHITFFAHGETAEFSSSDQDPNQRATISSTAPVPPPPPPPPPSPETDLCGPDISRPLADVLADVRTTFAGWTPTKKREACDTITSLTSAVMAWDITNLFLPCTGWLCGPPYHPPCGMPPTTGCDLENENECGNSVQVSAKCFLAGTVNYALFGQICKLCCDEFGDLCESTMIFLIRLWKLLPNPTQGLDDPGPPTAWARAGFHGYPGHIPSRANRPRCTPRCPVPYSGPAFSWVWEPHHPRSGCPSMP